MSVQMLETIKQQIASLSEQEQAALADYLQQQTQQKPPCTNGIYTAQPIVEDKRRLRAEWLKVHGEEYAGQYVALDGDHLLGAGKNFPEAAAAARRAGVSDAYVDYVYPPDYEGRMGGWS